MGALVESSPVCKPCEWPGPKGGFVIEAISSEDLVLFAEVLVNADVELIGPICGDRAAEVIVDEPRASGIWQEFQKFDRIRVQADRADRVRDAITLDLVANVTRPTGGQTGDTVRLSLSHRTSGSRVQDGPERKSAT